LAAWAQVPNPSQASSVQGLGSSGQALPTGRLDQLVVESEMSQRWQALVGLGVPLG
jgi:hypothetical protein